VCELSTSGRMGRFCRSTADYLHSASTHPRAAPSAPSDTPPRRSLSARSRPAARPRGRLRSTPSSGFRLPRPHTTPCGYDSHVKSMKTKAEDGQQYREHATVSKQPYKRRRQEASVSTKEADSECSNVPSMVPLRLVAQVRLRAAPIVQRLRPVR